VKACNLSSPLISERKGDLTKNKKNTKHSRLFKIN
jgi:hypothetical protein